MQAQQETTDNSSTRREIIKTAQLQCYQARSACLRARNELGAVPEEYRRELQNAILDYYWALRPLRTASTIQNWWENAELSEYLTYTRNQPQPPIEVRGSIDEPIQLVQHDQPQTPEEEHLTGLDKIPTLTSGTTSRTRTVNTMRGSETRTETVPKRPLAFEILADLSGVLDDAADRLGFGPEPRTPINDDAEPI